MTYLTISILSKSEEDCVRQIARAKAEGAEAVEVRIDAFEHPTEGLIGEVVGVSKKHELPVIITCRDKKQGGFRNIDLSTRLSILRRAVLTGADYIDVEFDNFKHPDVQSVLRAALEPSQTRLILSCHNFQGPFDDLNILYESILSVCPAAIPKIVYKARHVNDCFAAFDLLRQADRPAIVFCMGAAGQISRVLAKKFGAFLTFASLDTTSQTAPGQIPVSLMKDLYRWDHLNTDTEIFGVIGNPVAHSLSPRLFNTCFDKAGINAVYLPFLVEGDQAEFNAFLDHVCERHEFGFGGFSVTLPHKTHALDYGNLHGDYVDNLAQSIGSVNTLKIGFNGIVSAYNTDYAGAMDALVELTGKDRRSLHEAEVAVIGAGGVARAVVAGLIDVGAHVTIYNRTVSKAEALAKEFRCKSATINDMAQSHATILINCTSLGMFPKVETSPVPSQCLRPDMTVFDTVYTPLETRLLREARAVGATVVNGAEMFLRQAMAQYNIYIGSDPDPELMRSIIFHSLEASAPRE